MDIALGSSTSDDLESGIGVDGAEMSERETDKRASTQLQPSPRSTLNISTEDLFKWQRNFAESTLLATKTNGVYGLDEVKAAMEIASPLMLATTCEVGLVAPKAVLECRRASEAALVLSLQCIRLFFSQSVNLPPKYYIANLSYLSLILDGRILISQTPHLSEEISEALLEAMDTVIANSTPSTRDALQSESQRAVLGHSISSLLGCGAPEKESHSSNRKIRIKALGTLMVLLKSLPSASHIAIFLPGIASAAARVMLGDFKQGYAVFEASIQLWTTIVSLVMSDEWFPKDDDDDDDDDDNDDVKSNPTSTNPSINEKRAKINNTTTTNGGRNSNTTNATNATSTNASNTNTAITNTTITNTTTTTTAAATTSTTPTTTSTSTTTASSSSDDNDNFEAQRKSLSVVQTKEWWEATANNLKQHLEQLTSRTNHSSWRVRIAYVELCDSLLTSCKRSLLYAVPTLIEMLVDLSSDDYDSVREKATGSLTKCAGDTHTQIAFTLLCRENLLSLTKSLPRVIQNGNDEEIARTLNLLGGYVGILGNKMRTILTTTKDQNRFSAPLIQLLEFDTRDIKLIAERGTANVEHNEVLAQREAPRTHIASPFRKTFSRFRDGKIVTLASKLCRLLGFYGDHHSVLDHYLSILRTTTTARAQVGWIIGELMTGVASATPDELGYKNSSVITATDVDTHSSVAHDKQLQQRVKTTKNLIRMVLSAFVTDEMWRVPTHAGKLNQAVTDSTVGAAMTYTQNTVCLCIFVECIATFAKLLGEAFDPMLIIVLYPLMEQLGSETAIVSHVSWVTLHNLHLYLEYKSISEMVCANSDYLLNSISLNLRYLDLNANAPIVMQSMLQCCDERILDYVRDTVDEIFDALDGYEEGSLSRFLQILLTLVSSFCRWDDEARASAATNDDEGQTAPRTDNIEEETTKPELNHEKISDKYDIAVKVLDRCTHFAGSFQPRLRLLVLDTMAVSVRSLRHEEDKLLPAINTFWPSLVSRLKDEEIIVKMRAVGVLESLVAGAPDFMRSRIQNDALPLLKQFLRGGQRHAEQQQQQQQQQLQQHQHQQQQQQQHHQPHTAIHNNRMLKFSVGYRLEKTTLETVRAIVPSLDLLDEHGAELAEACIPYLHESCPQGLQESAMAVFRMLITTDPDAVWYLLVQTCTLPKLLTSPPQASGFVIPTLPKQLPGFHHNVHQLLQALS